VNTGRDLRLLVPAGAGWLACAMGTWLRPSGWWILGGIILALILVALAWRLSCAGLVSAVTSLVVAVVMLGAVALGVGVRDQARLVASDGETVEAQIRLGQTIVPGDRSARAEILALNGQALSRGPVPVRVVGDIATLRVPLGSVATVSANVSRGENNDQESWVLFVSEPPASWQAPGRVLSGSDSLRAQFLERSLQRPGDAGELLPGLAIGDTSAVDPGLVEAMRMTSLSHLVAVSGANCAVVVAIVVAIVALLGGGLWIRMIAGIAALIGFVILVTPEPSITRAAVMAAIVLFFLASARPVKGIPVLGITVLGLLAWDPWLSTDFAFVLSVVATGGILILTSPLVAMLSRWMHPGVALVVALPLAAQIACQPVLILLNPIIPVWAVVANALAAPAAPLATILGMLACISGPLSAGLANAITWLAWLPSGYIAAIGRVLAATPFSTLPWPSGWWGAVAVALTSYAGIAWVLMGESRRVLLRRVMGGLSVMSALTVIVLFFVPALAVRVSVPPQWSVAQCDVGQGDALVIRSEGKTALIDTGEFPDLLRRCLGLLGVSHLDLVVLTHFDKDHVGAWQVLVGITDEVWVGPRDSQGDRDIVSALEQGGARIVSVAEGHTGALGSYSLEVLWPSRAPLGAPGNDSSVVLGLRPASDCQKCLSGLFLGDLGEKTQQILAGRANLGRVDVVKVSHHGSASQFHPLYRTLGAQVGLIGVGADNTYGHPAGSILDVVAETATILRSDLSGTATLHRGETGGIVMWSER
jgi:competence protein ComEC